jgi:histidinol-phosphate aminotransferase
MRARVDTLVAERHRLSAALARLPGLTVYPSGANFVLVRVEGDGRALWQRLVDRGILVRDFSRWPRLDECLRITVGTPEEDDKLLDALTQEAA